jgi:hypothetical protein
VGGGWLVMGGGGLRGGRKLVSGRGVLLLAHGFRLWYLHVMSATQTPLPWHHPLDPPAAVAVRVT